MAQTPAASGAVLTAERQPQLQVIERFGKILRRRATHHRLFTTVAALRRALRQSLTVRRRR